MSAANSVNVTGNKIRTTTDVFPFGMTTVFSPLSQITLLEECHLQGVRKLAVNENVSSLWNFTVYISCKQ